MEKGSKSKSGSHKVFKDKTKSRLEDVLVMFTDLQSALKESRGNDVAVREEQLKQYIKEWGSELNQPSPASSLQQGASEGSFSAELSRLLHLSDEQDDATSVLAAPNPDTRKSDENAPFYQDLPIYQTPQVQSIKNCEGSPSVVNYDLDDIANQLDFISFGLDEDFDPNFFSGLDGNISQQMTGFSPTISPPPSAYLGPICALWDCSRPVQENPDYCSSYHAVTAQNEGQLGKPPVLRPKGIELKDSLLFAALSAKSQGKDVGVPECEGAATAKSPWNAPELFDLSLFEGETLREWLFFDKPRRAFESGNRKQRSLPDYNGRGWHESRKQVINDSGWLKRSYYMDPQPSKDFEWHLFEYEISKCDPRALYRLELKVVDGKKTPKGKTANVSVADHQKQMGRLTAVSQLENNKSNRSGKGRGRANLKDNNVGSTVHPCSNPTPRSNGLDPNPTPQDEGLDSFDYLVEDVGDYYFA